MIFITFELVEVAYIRPL